MQVIEGISPLASKYELFLVDVWGVLHNGIAAFDDAVDCLEQLKSHNKKVVLVSNAPRCHWVITAQLEKLGVSKSLYNGIASSGEVGRSHLKAPRNGIYKDLGNRYYMLGNHKDIETPKGLGLEAVTQLEQADFVFNCGPRQDGEGLEPYIPILQEAKDANIPMICLNPDVEVIIGTKRWICAGAIARHLEKIGGKVYYHGKPHKEIFEFAAHLAELELADTKAVVIGDSLGTDIKGANQSGLDSILALSGIHKEATHDDKGNLCLEKLKGFLEGSPTPTMVAEKFCW